MAFNGLNTLEDLDISHNQLNRVPPISSVKNTILQLDISWNEISHISDTYFITFYHWRQTIFRMWYPYMVFASRNSRPWALEWIKLKVSVSPPPPANFAPSVDMVDLHSNYIQIIYFSLAHGPRKHKVYINLEQNPWHCNSSLGWTQQCSQDAHRNVMTCFKWLSVAGMICVSPPGAQGLIPKEAGEILYIYTIQFAKLMQ